MRKTVFWGVPNHFQCQRLRGLPTLSKRVPKSLKFITTPSFARSPSSPSKTEIGFPISILSLTGKWFNCLGCNPIHPSSQIPNHVQPYLPCPRESYSHLNSRDHDSLICSRSLVCSFTFKPISTMGEKDLEKAISGPNYIFPADPRRWILGVTTMRKQQLKPLLPFS